MQAVSLRIFVLVDDVAHAHAFWLHARTVQPVNHTMASGCPFIGADGMDHSPLPECLGVRSGNAGAVLYNLILDRFGSVIISGRPLFKLLIPTVRSYSLTLLSVLS